MKITFVVPPVLNNSKPTERSSGCTFMLYPMVNIFELTVAAVLEKEGHIVKYTDCVEQKWKQYAFERFLTKNNSDSFCIWSVNLGIQNDLLAHQLIRKYHPKAFIIFMGPAPTFSAEIFIRDNHTFVIRGEPEISTAELVNALNIHSSLGEIKGISYKKENTIVHNMGGILLNDLDLLPFPARHLINKSYYHNPKLHISPYTAVISSRNCPYKCIYCVPTSLSFARELEFKRNKNKKPPIAKRSVENLLDEFKLLHQQGYKGIAFMDDNFIWGEERTQEICKGLIKYNFVWGCQTRADSITENIAKLLGESNCKYVDLGIESFDQRILDYIKKGLTAEQAEKAILLLKKYNVPVKLNILLGAAPFETRDTIKATYKKIKQLKVDQVMFSLATPFPGTEFYNICKTNGWLIDGEYTPTNIQRKAIVNYPNLTKKELEKAIFYNNLKFFTQPYLIKRNLNKISSVKDFTILATALKRKIIG